MLANTLPLLIAMNHVGSAIYVVVLDIQALNAQVYAKVENKNVWHLAKLVKNNAWLSHHDLLMLQPLLSQWTQISLDSLTCLSSL
jgi:hypothetical protein